MRAAMTNPHIHLDYIDWLAEQELACRQGDVLADLSAAAHLSVTDYFGDIDWDRHPEARTWYAKIKSRPAFRDLLEDVVAGLTGGALRQSRFLGAPVSGVRNSRQHRVGPP